MTHRKPALDAQGKPITLLGFPVVIDPKLPASPMTQAFRCETFPEDERERPDQDCLVFFQGSILGWFCPNCGTKNGRSIFFDRDGARLHFHVLAVVQCAVCLKKWELSELFERSARRDPS